MGELEKLLKSYLDYLEIEKNRAPKTRENYEHYLRAFLRIAKVASLKDLNEENIQIGRASCRERV